MLLKKFKMKVCLKKYQLYSEIIGISKKNIQILFQLKCLKQLEKNIGIVILILFKNLFQKMARRHYKL